MGPNVYIYVCVILNEGMYIHVYTSSVCVSEWDIEIYINMVYKHWVNSTIKENVFHIVNNVLVC